MGLGGPWVMKIGHANSPFRVARVYITFVYYGLGLRLSLRRVHTRCATRLVNILTCYVGQKREESEVSRNRQTIRRLVRRRGPGRLLPR